MAKLEAMLEQRGIATPREMSEAIARCQLHGGDLTTSLLQFVSADETLLSATLSECYGLPATSVGLLPAPDDAALRSLPRDVAERYCCFPLEASPGRLVLAVSHPLEASLREELSLTLGVMVEERVALEVRIRQALSRFYGLPLTARNQRGIARLEGDVEVVGHETPLGLWSDTQLSNLPRPPSELLASQRDPLRPPSVRPRSRSETPRYGSGSAPPSSGTRASRRRGPLSLAKAREDLGRSPTRNEVLDIFFGFASQFFEYSALFAVHNALAEGLDAWGKGADRDAVLGIGVPLDLPSSLSEAAESCKVRLTRLGKEGIDRTLMADLQRQFNAKALILPVSLRGRCAVLLYADNGEADVVEREVADVIAISVDVANALGRIILQRKKDGSRQRVPEALDLAGALERRLPATESSLAQPFELTAREGSPAALRAERDESVRRQPVVAIESPTPDPSGQPSDAESGEDPVFLLARPQGKATASQRSPFASSVQKPQVSITHPAPIIATRPRLPSVIVEPDSADPEASERATRAAAVTRAPTQARSAYGRRPAVPPLADVPRTLSPPQRDARPAAVAIAASREPVLELDEAASLETTESEELGTGEAELLTEEEAIGATASRGWPPPIMDNSPPPRQQALTALVPIIIADPPKGRRSLNVSRNSGSNRAGAKPSLSRTGMQRSSSNPPPSSHGAASPTVPSPARSRKVEPASAPSAAVPASAALAAADLPAAATSGAAPRSDAPSATARGLSAASANPFIDLMPTLGEAVLAAATAGPSPASTGSSPATGAPALANGAPPARHATALAKAAARSSSAHGSPEAIHGVVAQAAEPQLASSPLRDEAPATTGAAESSLAPVPLPSPPAEATPTRPAPQATDAAPPAAEPAESAANERASRPPLASVLAAHATASSSRPAAAAKSAAASDAAVGADAVPSAGVAIKPAAARVVSSADETRTAPSTWSFSDRAPDSAEISDPLAWPDTVPPSAASTLPVSAPASPAPALFPSTPAVAISRSIVPPIATRSYDADRAPDSAEISDPLAWPDTNPPSPFSLVPLSAGSKPIPSAPSPPPPSRVSNPAPSTRTVPVLAAPSSSEPPRPTPASGAPPASSSMPSGAPTDPVAAASSGSAGDRPAIFPPPPPVDTEIEELVERACQGNLRAVQDLARIGAPSLPLVMARFPGPVISERAGPTSRASECGPLLQALAAIGSPAMPSITHSSEHEDARVRRWATLLLGEMPGPEACRAVVERLADDVPRVHQAALDAARLLLAGPAADLFRKTLFEVAEAEDAPLTLRLRTLEHVAKLKDSASVPRLCVFLGADTEPIVHKALWALTVVTRHDFGRDARAWTDFWHSNQSRHRLEWLIDALDDRDPRLRKAAADELREVVGESFAYAEHLTRSERLEAQSKFRTWWQTSGAARHGRVS